MSAPRQVKNRLPHTWPLFFARHGSFTPIQLQAIPPILDGSDTLLIAATASGKTEAVIAPLLERNWPRLNRLDQHELGILYICPTRALVRDLYERLWPALATTDVTLAMKTGDTGPLNRPPAILLTTPESTDSLLTRAPRLFTSLQAIVLDEIHLFDNTPRGDHLRCLLPRLEHIRHYADPETSPAQRVALSATVPDAEGVARRYLQSGATIVNSPGSRPIVADVWPLYDLNELTAALGQRAAQKSLVFCNSRTEVEQTAAYLRQQLPYHAEIFVHYSNLDSKLRQDVETRFAAAAVAICICTSTLELGIDIGSVDDIVLLGAPHDLTSFLQRIGRGSRRTAHTRVLCLPKSPGEWARFEALLQLGQGDDGRWTMDDDLSSLVHRPSSNYAFRPSVLVQQIFSLIKQSKTGSIRLADVRRVAPAEVTSEAIRQIVSHLTFARYLRPGRLGEWKPDSELQELLDRHEIYSNIGAELLAATAVDAYSGKVIAQTDRAHDKGTVLLFGGRRLEVVWRDNARFGLAPAAGKEVDEILRFQHSHALIPFDVAQAVAGSLALRPAQMATLPAESGMWLYHFWGTVWGELLTSLLLAHSISAEFINEYCIHVQPALSQLPPWDNSLVRRVARSLAIALAGRLEMGRFHPLLPANVAVAAAIEQLSLEPFEQVYRAARLTPAAADTTERLRMLAT